MAPLLRRTWAPRGVTPILQQRTRARDKVSMVAALAISPARRRLSLYFALHPNANINAVRLVEFLRALARQRRGPVILIWDRLGTHRGRLARAFLRRHPRIRAVLLPPYAPELNPVEPFWGHLKGCPLANFAAVDAAHLAKVAARHARHASRRPSLLRGFFRATGLPLRLR